MPARDDLDSRGARRAGGALTRGSPLATPVRSCRVGGIEPSSTCEERLVLAPGEGDAASRGVMEPPIHGRRSVALCRDLGRHAITSTAVPIVHTLGDGGGIVHAGRVNETDDRDGGGRGQKGGADQGRDPWHAKKTMGIAGRFLGLRLAQTVITILPRAWPPSSSRIASAASMRG